MRQRATRLFSIGSGRRLGVVPILDQLGIAAAAAYSLRRVRLAAPLACRVRRSSDNAELNIGFTASGDLDAAALLAFVGAGDGFVVTWYDQSGNGRNAVQTTAGGQPQIVSNGVIQTQNGRATVAQSLVTQSLPISAAFTGMTSATGVFVFRQLVNTGVGAGAHGFRMDGGNSTANNHSPANGVNALDGFFSANRMQFNNYGPSTTLTIHTPRQTGTALQLFKNGTQIAGDQTVAFATYASEKAFLMDTNPNGTVALSEGIVFGTALSTADRQLIERNQGAYYGISLLALDQLTTPSAAAYSLRKLRNAYTGSAIRVRRSSDNAELDIGFAVNSDLDTAALLSFVGSGNGFVTTWHDQSGNGRDAAQTDSTKQPRIVSNGVMNTINGRAALSFDDNDSMQRTNIGTVFSTSAGFEFQTVVDLVSRATNGFSSLPVTVMNSPAVRVVDGYLRSLPLPAEFSYLPGNSGIVNAWPTFSAYDVSPVNAPPAIVGYNATSSTAALFQNGVITAVSATPGTFAQTGITLTIGGRTDTTTSFTGNMSEIVGFGGTLSTTDRQTLERNQGAYYGIAVA